MYYYLPQVIRSFQAFKKSFTAKCRLKQYKSINVYFVTHTHIRACARTQTQNCISLNLINNEITRFIQNFDTGVPAHNLYRACKYAARHTKNCKSEKLNLLLTFDSL
jgi:hypothetical protein